MTDQPAYRRRVAWSAIFGAWLVRLIGATWRFRVRNGEAFDRLVAEGRPYVILCWHGQLLPLIYYHRRNGIAILVSEHADGEIIARIATSIGYGTVRGSTSRGAGRALIELTRTLNAGVPVAVTPDGPRGPARSFAPGALVAGQRAGVPVVTVAASASRSWRLKSWDSFLIPKPFARVTIGYGPMAQVQADSPREAATEVERFSAYMADAERTANE